MNTFNLKKVIKIGVISLLVLLVFLIYVYGQKRDDITPTKTLSESKNQQLKNMSVQKVVSEKSDEGIEKFKYNDDDTVTLGPGSRSYGLFNINTNKIVPLGSVLEVTNGCVEGIVKFEQNIDGNKNYALIFLVDYLQTDFIVESNIQRTYKFELSGYESIDIPFTIENIADDAFELSYIIISEPQLTKLSVESSDETIEFLKTNQIRHWRLLLGETNVEIKEAKYIKDYIIEPSDSYDGIYLSEKNNPMKSIPMSMSQATAEITIGNNGDFEMNYVLFALLDWEQVPLIANQKLEFFSVPDHSAVHFEIKLPQVYINTPFQVIMVPNPYGATEEIKGGSLIQGSLRTVIMPNK